MCPASGKEDSCGSEGERHLDLAVLMSGKLAQVIIEVAC